MEYFQIELKQRFPELGAEGRNPKITLYLPYNNPDMGRQDDLRPTVLLCPGGGYTWVSPREGEPIAMILTSWGYNVVELDYSVQGSRYPTQLIEVAAVMELLHENAGAWHCDVDRIAVMGFSAGGHLAAMYSNSFDSEPVRKIFPHSKGVKASVLCYPVITAVEGLCHPGSFRNLLGHDYPLTQEEINTVSCEKLVTEATPPAFIWHTAADQAVPVVNSLLYAQALSAYKIPFALHIYPVGVHGLSTVDSVTNKPLDSGSLRAHTWKEELRGWLEDFL